MLYLNNHAKNKITTLDYNNMYIVADFDRTITVNSSDNSWGILEKSNFVCEEYTKESLELYNYYYPIEFDNSIDPITKDKLMNEWWSKVIYLFVKYKLKEEVVNNATSNIQIMKFRDGGKEFLTDMYNNNIPVIIISAGIGNFIEQFLKYNNCMFNNIYLISNFIRFENGIAVGIEDTIIHTFNKNIVSLNENILNKIGDRKNIVLLGDNLADIKMVPDEKRDDTVRIGFLDYNIEENLGKYKENFDIVGTNDTSFKELSKVLKLNKNKNSNS